MTARATPPRAVPEAQNRPNSGRGNLPHIDCSQSVFNLRSILHTLTEHRFLMKDRTMLAKISNEAQAPRDIKQSVKRGLMMKCPRCGDGAIFSRYLKVAPECPCCGLDLTPQRADDGPAYVVILLMCHLGGFLMAFLWETYRMEPMLMASLTGGFVVAMSIWMLPRVKGAFVAVQWANRMHGFAHANA